MLTGRRLCVCVELETHFIFNFIFRPYAHIRTFEDRLTTACERVTFSGTAEVIVVLSICIVIQPDTKMSLFQPKWLIKNCISQCFSAMNDQTGLLNTYHITTHQALSKHLCSIVTTHAIPDFDEKHKSRVFSASHSETRLNSCVCEVHEGRYSTDNNSAQRACFLKSIERARDP